jgi:hypothetical protein
MTAAELVNGNATAQTIPAASNAEINIFFVNILDTPEKPATIIAAAR